MTFQVCLGADLKCDQAVPPGMSKLVVLPPPLHTCLTSFKPAANIKDHVPFMNIMPFGMCNAKANPTVIAATSAAMGTPTPGACLPATPAPWSSGSASVKVDNQPALNKSSTLKCVYGGTISIVMEGQSTHKIP